MEPEREKTYLIRSPTGEVYKLQAATPYVAIQMAIRLDDGMFNVKDYKRL